MCLFSSVNRFYLGHEGPNTGGLGDGVRETQNTVAAQLLLMVQVKGCSTKALHEHSSGLTGMAIHDLPQPRLGGSSQNCIMYFSHPKFWVLITYPLAAYVRHQLYEKVFCSSNFWIWHFNFKSSCACVMRQKMGVSNPLYIHYFCTGFMQSHISF